MLNNSTLFLTITFSGHKDGYQMVLDNSQDDIRIFSTQNYKRFSKKMHSFYSAITQKELLYIKFSLAW